MTIKLRNFESMILFFNGMYKLPIAPYPRVFDVVENESKKDGGAPEFLNAQDIIAQRIHHFKQILSDEVKEVDDIAASLLNGFRVKDSVKVEPEEEYTPLHFLTDMADWLTDIQIYCASEMVKYGIPVEETQRIVMESNFSKLGLNGEPMYDDRGKVQKGPMYWKPEPALMAMLAAKISEHNSPGTGEANEP